MRLIDADALDIDNLNRAYNDNFELDFGRLYTTDVIDMIANAPTINAIPIPDNATNGDVIKTMFPQAKVFGEDTSDYPTLKIDMGSHDEYVDFYIDWWNAPYKAESEDNE